MSAHAYTPAELEGVAKRLGGSRASGGGWSCRCPAHDDRTASMSLGLGEGGRLLWHCFAGCDQAAVLAGLKSAGVLLNGDARPAEPWRETRPKSRTVATYPYVDESGVLLFEVVRREPKDFRQRRPDGDGGWIWKLEDTRRVLYRLPEVVAAEEVWFVEGEKDADSFAVAGLCGTTSPQGAKFWRDELAAPLAGKRVVVLPDNDDAGRRHAQTVAAAARRHGAASVKVLELPGLPPKGDVSDWLAAGHGADELRAMMAAAPEWEPWEAEADEAADTRPLIRIRGGELHRHVEAAAEALGSASRAHPFEGVYRRGTLLVRPGRVESGAEPERAGLRRAPGTLTILTVSTDYLTLALTRCARWEKLDGRAKAGVPANAPENVAAALASASDQLLPIPMLAGIVEAPTIRADGTLLDRPGYDPATRLLFDPGGVEFPPIPESPTREEAEAALALLREPLAEFPFAGEGSETVILSQILTALVRKSMRAAPLHLVTAPTMASGKTLLATIGGYVATGRAPAMMSQATDPAEERKRLLALLLEGSPMVVVDNIERPLESDALCSILTEPLFTDRVLGMSRTATAPTNALFVATGNNATVAGDLTTRTIAATLDAKVERPEERRFKLNLHEWVPANRGRLVAAALTIIRGYIAAGEPRSGKLPNFARFEDWTRRVREPLTWLGMEDPCKGRERVEGRDPVRAQLGGLIAAWHENYPGCAATTAEAVRLATREPTMTEAEADTAARGRLRDAIAEVASGRNGVSPGSLGKFIAKHEGRFEGGLCFEKKGVSHQAALWGVTVPPPRATPGEFGEFGEFGQPLRAKLSEAEAEAEQGDTYAGGREANSPNSPNSPAAPPRAEPATTPPPGPGVPKSSASPTGNTPPWTDDRAWCRLVGEARRHDDKLSTVLRWGEAAGGTVGTWGERVQLTLPPGLPKGMAQTELRRFAREMGVDVRSGTYF